MHGVGALRRGQAVSAAYERAALEVLKEAARAYADATDGSHGEDPLTKAALLRLAAKTWRRAERLLNAERLLDATK
jgi:hypothetical protein